MAPCTWPPGNCRWADCWYSRLRIPPPAEKPAPDPLVAAGEKPTFGKVLGTRWARARRYNATDIERVRQTLGGLPWGQSAEDLVQFNNAMRLVGVVVKTSVDRLT